MADNGLLQLIAEQAASIPVSVAATVSVLDGLESVIRSGTGAKQQQDYASAGQGFADAEQAAREQYDLLDQQRLIASNLLKKCQEAGLPDYEACFQEILALFDVVTPYAIMRDIQSVGGALETKIDASPAGTLEEISRLFPYAAKLEDLAGTYQKMFSLVTSENFRETGTNLGNNANLNQCNVWANGSDGAPSPKFRELCGEWVQMCGFLAVHYQGYAISLLSQLSAVPADNLQMVSGGRISSHADIFFRKAYDWALNAQDAVSAASMAGVNIALSGEVLKVRENVLAHYSAVLEATGIFAASQLSVE